MPLRTQLQELPGYRFAVITALASSLVSLCGQGFTGKPNFITVIGHAWPGNLLYGEVEWSKIGVIWSECRVEKEEESSTAAAKYYA